jgi:opacity protein-like surface antigen
MKKSFIISSVMWLSLVTAVNAQDSMKVAGPPPSFPVVEFGFRFMPTFSSFDMQTSSGGTIKGEVTLGYGVGGMLGFNFSNHVGIQGEVIYNSLSQKYKDQGLQREINVRYINVPLLLSLNTGKGNPVNLNMVLGPQFGLNIGSSIKGSSGSSTDTLTTVLAAKTSDLGFAYGAGVEFMLNSTRSIRLGIGFRGVYGFVNISNTNQSSDPNTYYILNRATIRTNSAYLGIAFLF